MLEGLREYLERDLSRAADVASRRVQLVRQIVIASYLTLAVAGAMAFAVLIFAASLSHRYPVSRIVILNTAFLVAVGIVLSADLLRSDRRYLGAAARQVDSIERRFSNRTRQDFLVRHYWASIGVLWIPVSITAIAVLRGFQTFVMPGLQAFERDRDTLTQLVTFSGAVLAAQLTLITFLSSSLLGRYSSLLAVALVTHPAVVSLLLFSLTLVLGSISALTAGYPDSVASLFPLFGLLAFTCLAISVMVITSGVSTDRAIEYAGHRFGNRIRRRIPRPLTASNLRDSPIRKILAAYGFYVLDSSRMALLQPSVSRLAEVEMYLMALFNAASKAIHEEQQEVLRASLRAIRNCASAYTERRRDYAGSQDDIFGFMNHRFAAVMKSAAKASNESLVSDVIESIGLVGLLSLRIGAIPSSISKQDAAEKILRRSHPLALFWIGLLKDGFYVSHSLMRSTAPSSAIWQIGLLAGAAVKLGHSDVIRFNYLPTMEELHALCSTFPDAYHIELAGQCLGNVLLVWSVATLVADSESFYEIHEGMVEAIFKIGAVHLELRQRITFLPSLRDMTSILTAKLDMETPILQDVFVLVARRQGREKWEEQARAKELQSIVKLTSDLGSKAVEKDDPMANYYGQALYEIACCTSFVDLSLPLSTKEAVETTILESWESIVPMYYGGHNISAHNWEEPMFGVLGLAIAVYSERPTAALKKKLLDCSRLYLELVKKEDADRAARVADDTWDYLQLLGAWVRTFLGDTRLSNEVMQAVSYGRPFVFDLLSVASGRSGKYASLGYPTTLFSDYSLPQPRNLPTHLKDSDIEKLQGIQSRLFSDETLLPFAQDIRKIRRQLRKRLEERRQQSSSSNMRTRPEEPEPPETKPEGT